MAQNNKYVNLIVFILFLLSGCSSLIYEVIWTKELVLVFGVTAFAISTVLVAFMAGLALGSFVFGRIIDRYGKPVLVYAILEGLIAIYALLVPFIFSASNHLFKLIYIEYSQSVFILTFSRFIISFFILVFPTTLMGATLPVLGKFFIKREEKVGTESGLLYFINTFGAVVGCLAAGFILIPKIGLYYATIFAVSLNLIITIIAIIVGFSLARSKTYPVDAVERKPASSLPLKWSSLRAWLLIAICLSGFSALVMEIIWTRVLIMVFGSTVYSFSTMLGVFLLGIALGSVVFSSIVDRVRSSILLFGIIEIFIAFLIIASASTVDYLPYFFLTIMAKAGLSYNVLTWTKFLLAFLVLFPVAFLFGATFPAVVKSYLTSMEKTGTSIGNIYSSNTLGAILGSFAGGFILLPLIGMRGSFLFSAILVFIIGIITLFFAGFRARRVFATIIFIIIFLVSIFLLPHWDKTLLASGVYFQPQTYIDSEGKLDLRNMMRNMEVLYYSEGINDTITVVKSPTEKILSVNGKIVATSRFDDMIHLRLLGHIPTLLHPGNPERALNIGLGAGVTLGALSLYPYKRVDVAEIEPSVIEACQKFSKENHDILESPKLNIILEDGRNYLSLSDNKYDIISSDPFHPIVTGAGNLYAEEHFRISKEHLNPDGVMCQWLPFYHMSDTDFKSIIATFARVFPNTTIWNCGNSALLIGMKKEHKFDIKHIQEKIDQMEIENSLDEYGFSNAYQVLASYMCDASALQEYLKDAPINTDDQLFLEYSVPKSIFAMNVGPNFAELLEYSETLEDFIRKYLNSENITPEEIDKFKHAFKFIRLGIEGIADLYNQKIDEGLSKLEESYANEKNNFIGLQLADAYEKYGALLQSQNRIQEAAGYYEKAIELDPNRVDSFGNLGYMYYFLGEHIKAKEMITKALSLSDQSAKLHIWMAIVYDALGNLDEAFSFYKRALDLQPDYPKANELMGVYYLGQKNFDEAIRYLNISKKLQPFDAPTLESLTEAYFKADDLKMAESTANDLIDLDPESLIAREFLAQIYFINGDLEKSESQLISIIASGYDNASIRYHMARIKIVQNNRDAAMQNLNLAIEMGGEVYLNAAKNDAVLKKLFE